MKRAVLLLLSTLLIFALPVSANDDLTHTHTFINGYSVGVPDGWLATTDFYVFNTTTYVNMTFYLPDQLTRLGASQDDLTEVLRDAYRPGDTFLDFAPQRIEFLEMANRRAWRYDYVDLRMGSQHDRVLVALPLFDGTVVVADIIPISTTTIIDLFVAFDILASVAGAADNPDLTQVQVINEDYEVRYPLGWFLTFQHSVSNDETALDLVFYTPSELAANNLNNLEDVLDYGFRHNFRPNDDNVTWNPGSLKELDIPDRTGVRYDLIDTFQEEQYEKVLAAVQLSDGSVALAKIVPLFGFDLVEEQLALKIVNSLRVAE